MIEMLNNLGDLVAFFREFLVNPEAKPPDNRFKTGFLLEEIQKCSSGRVEQILFLLKAIEIYTSVLSLFENDIIPFAFLTTPKVQL